MPMPPSLHGPRLARGRRRRWATGWPRSRNTHIHTAGRPTCCAATGANVNLSRTSTMPPISPCFDRNEAAPPGLFGLSGAGSRRWWRTGRGQGSAEAASGQHRLACHPSGGAARHAGGRRAGWRTWSAAAQLPIDALDQLLFRGAAGRACGQAGWWPRRPSGRGRRGGSRAHDRRAVFRRALRRRRDAREAAGTCAPHGRGRPRTGSSWSLSGGRIGKPAGSGYLPRISGRAPPPASPRRGSGDPSASAPMMHRARLAARSGHRP